MKILHVITTARPESGGPIEGVLQRGKRLKEMGHFVEIASVDDPSTIDGGSNIPIHALGPGSGGFQRSKDLLPWLKQNVSRFDAVVVNGVWQYNGVAARSACLAANVPYFVFTHGMLDPWFKETYPAKHLKKMLFWPWQHAVLRDAKAVLFTTEEERLLARKSFKPYRVTERVVAYGTSAPPPGSPSQREAFLALVPDAADHLILLYLSRIHAKKGVDLLIEAFAKTLANDPAWLLVIAGPDAEGIRPQLDALAVNLGVDGRIRWPGMLRDDAKWGALRAAEGYILPSHQENFGIAVAEAMACGTPVMITNKVNIWREVEAGGGGLVEPDTLEGVTSLLARFQALSDVEITEMGEQARKTFQTQFDVGPMAQSLLDVISEFDPQR